MAKTKISEFSSTPANNTDIDSINIAEGCAPSGINDAIRELMAQLKDFQTGAAGDSFNGPVGTTTAAAGAFTTLTASSTATLNTLASSGATLTGGSINNMTIGGTTAAAVSATTLTTSSTVTLNGGTANGVAYLNGSKVLTTGSALTFDGSSLGIGIAPTAKLDVSGGSGAIVNVRGTGDAYQEIAGGGRTPGTGSLLVGQGNAGEAYFWNRFNSYTAFGVNNSEQMRLTSTGLGIGTSSPGVKLDVAAATAIARLTSTTGTNVGYYQVSNTGGGLYIGRDSFAGGGFYSGSPAYGAIFLSTGAYPMAFAVDSVERMRLDASGNLGLGVTPSAWQAGTKAIEIGASSSISNIGTTTGITVGANIYRDSSWRYKLSAERSTLYEQFNGQHAWYTAPSGTAGNAISFTQALSLTAAGNLLLGGTTDPGGTKVLYIGNGTTPGTPTSGGVLYVESGALKYKGSSGTVTTLGAA